MSSRTRFCTRYPTMKRVAEVNPAEIARSESRNFVRRRTFLNRMTTLAQGFSNWVNAGPREGGQTTHFLKFNSRRALRGVDRGTAVSKCVHWQVVQVRCGDWTEVQEIELGKKAI